MLEKLLPFKQVDVFTQRPFLGNPVAVVIGADALQADEMQRIAAWTNLSETTFAVAASSHAADYRLRIFTPKQELPFAGHPTIGSAHAVIESGFASPRNGKLRQECLAGILDLWIHETGDGKRIMVQAPKSKITAVGNDSQRALAQALGQSPASSAPVLRVDMGVVWIVADMGDADAVAALSPDMHRLIELSAANQATGVTVFGRSDDGVAALHARSFAPIQGVPEDPVCGSGNASVAAFLIHTGLVKQLHDDYLARQGMAVGRDGRVSVSIRGDMVQIGGYAVTCVDGSLRCK